MDISYQALYDEMLKLSQQAQIALAAGKYEEFFEIQQKLLAAYSRLGPAVISALSSTKVSK